jgi:hypothetical protein
MGEEAIGDRHRLANPRGRPQLGQLGLVQLLSARQAALLHQPIGDRSHKYPIDFNLQVS